MEPYCLVCQTLILINITLGAVCCGRTSLACLVYRPLHKVSMWTAVLHQMLEDGAMALLNSYIVNL